MWQTIKEQVNVVFRDDPAAKNVFEVLLCYPGVHAILLHRVSHRLYHWGLHVVARLLSHFGRWVTGIEIHPGAKIGKRFFIDHGMGVVIGDTVEIGDDVLLYQGVTLGGTGHEQGKRHPTLGNHVVIGSGAKVLGNIVLGNWVRVGAGSVVVRSVPDHSTVVGIPGRVVAIKGVAISEEEETMLEHRKLPDPVGQALSSLHTRIASLEEQLRGKSEEAPPLASNENNN